MSDKTKYKPKRMSGTKAKKGFKARVKQLWKKVGTLNIVLLLVFAFFLWFNWQMLQLFDKHESIPEGYACAVIAAVLGECGFCGWIRTTKDKQRERKWSEADARRLEAQAKKEAQEPPDE